MSRLVKDFVEFREHVSLDVLIARLSELRDSLPPEADAEMRIRGDEFFGRHLCISFYRQQTEDEAACEARYADAHDASRGDEGLRAAA